MPYKRKILIDKTFFQYAKKRKESKACSVTLDKVYACAMWLRGYNNERKNKLILIQAVEYGLL
jgi:histidinol phosphatase-like enzyme